MTTSPDIVTRLRQVNDQNCTMCDDPTTFIRCGRGDCAEDFRVKEEAAAEIEALRAAVKVRDAAIEKLRDECRAVRLAEQLLLDGHSDPATMQYGDALVAMPKARAATDAIAAMEKP